jgi:hypothetical protein
MRAALVLWSALAAAGTPSGPSLKQAATLYHQGLYDSALTILEACRSGTLKRRDSLALFQYSGMASARLGRDDEASEDFRSLLALDSLFQFPRNEDSAVLAAFAHAREPLASAQPGRDSARTVAAPQPPVASLADAGPAAALPVTARLPPLPDAIGASGPRQPGVGLAMGAIPFGAGWLAKGRTKQGWALAVLQAGGLALSLYSSSRMTAAERNGDGIHDHAQLQSELGWQWTQRVTLSIALGTYLFSLIASRGE